VHVSKLHPRQSHGNLHGSLLQAPRIDAARHLPIVEVTAQLGEPDRPQPIRTDCYGELREFGAGCPIEGQ
jgi:hypothetical protein